MLVRPQTTDRRKAGKQWAALISQIYETDPLICPECGSEMKRISFIESRQTEVTSRSLTKTKIDLSEGTHLSTLSIITWICATY